MAKETLSYNEQKNQDIKLRHIFFPSTYMFVCEAILGIILVVIFNASALSNLFLNNASGDNPFSYATGLLHKAFVNLEQNHVFQQVAIFLLWALVGSLIYILLFKLFWITHDAGVTVEEGVKMVKQNHASGFISWLDSLHDFFIKMLALLAGVCIIAFGTSVCFLMASQELTLSFIYSFPANLLAILFFIITSILSIRLIMLGITLLLRDFRNWYISA